MKKGIYIVANNRVADNAIALLNSIRHYDNNVPVFLIPFNDDYEELADKLSSHHNVQVFPDLEFLDKFTKTVGEIFDRDFLALPNKMRKLVAWFGPLDYFLYIDTDIIVFEKIANILDYLSEYDFLCCDFHYSGQGLNDIFSSLVKEQNIFTDEELLDVFNGGFWASKKEAISETQMYKILSDCAKHREYFDFSRQTTDQPILNYIVLKSMPKRLNLVKNPDGVPGSWAGSKHFEEREHILYDHGKRLMYLHWAGIRIQPDCPYWDIWKYYRYFGEPMPSDESLRTQLKKGIFQKLKEKLKGCF